MRLFFLLFLQLLVHVSPTSLSLPSAPLDDAIISYLQSESLQLSTLQTNIKNSLYQHKISIGAFTHPLTYSLTCACLLTKLLTYSLNHSLNHSLTHSLTHSCLGLTPGSIRNSSAINKVNNVEIALSTSKNNYDCRISFDKVLIPSFIVLRTFLLTYIL